MLLGKSFHKLAERRMGRSRYAFVFEQLSVAGPAPSVSHFDGALHFAALHAAFSD